MQNAGYTSVVAFVLPENCWIDNYFTPLIPVREEFLLKYAGNHSATTQQGTRHAASIQKISIKSTS